MKKHYLILIICLFSLGCSHSNKKAIITKEKRVLYEFELDSLKRTYNYSLDIESNDTLIIFRYKHNSENRKNMTIKFNSESNILTFGTANFELLERNKYLERKISKYQFDFYTRIDPGMDDNGPMLFNSKYGILNVDNGWGTNYIYLKEEKCNDIAENIVNLLNK